MSKLIKIKSNLSINIINIILLLLLPFVSFLSKNFVQKYFISNNFFIFIVLIIIVFIIILLISKILDKYTFHVLKNFNLISFFCIFWYLQFFYFDIKNYITYFQEFTLGDIFYPGIFSILIIIFLSNFIYVYFTKKIISLFIFYFCTINLIFNLIPLLNQIDNRTTFNNYNENVNLNFQNNNINIEKPDIFYILADGLTSIKNLQDFHKFDTFKIERKLHNLGFEIAKNSYSSYNTTYLTLASIFSLDYMIDEKSNVYSDRINFYPNMLMSKIPNLVKKLNNENYKFLLISNSWARCNKSFKINCVYGSKNSLFNVMEDYSVTTFLSKSLVGQMYKLSRDTLTNYFTNFKKFDPHNAIKMFENEFENNMTSWKMLNKFTFIHHYIPHENRNSDCSIPKNKSIYSDSVKCVFLETFKIIKKILENFPNAIIVIQGDHGPSDNKYDWEADFNDLSIESVVHRMGIFNAIKLPEYYKKNFNNSIGNVETINLVIDCIKLKKNFFVPKSKSFVGFYENHKDFGKVYKFK